LKSKFIVTGSDDKMFLERSVGASSDPMMRVDVDGLTSAIRVPWAFWSGPVTKRGRVKVIEDGRIAEPCSLVRKTDEETGELESGQAKVTSTIDRGHLEDAVFGLEHANERFTLFDCGQPKRARFLCL
jgi:hypothetical protein